MAEVSRNAPCPCGSGKKFKHCCGAGPGAAAQGPAAQAPAEARPGRYDASGYMANRPFGPEKWESIVASEPEGRAIIRNAVPPGFLVVQNALDEAACANLVRECDTVEGVRSTIVSQPGSTDTTQSETRTSEFIDVRRLDTDIPALVGRMFREVVEPHYGATVEWFELPEILRYGPGGEYLPHADSENWHADKKEWVRARDRDLSLLLYLNGEFTGGEIDFPNFGMKIPPKRGMLITFPSDARYVHTAHPVMSGKRYVIACWAAVKGGPRINAEPPQGAIVPAQLGSE